MLTSSCLLTLIPWAVPRTLVLALLQEPLGAVRNGLSIDTNVIRACVDNQVGTIVYASSVSVYPKSEQTNRKVSFREEDSDGAVEPEEGMAGRSTSQRGSWPLSPAARSASPGSSTPTAPTST